MRNTAARAKQSTKKLTGLARIISVLPLLLIAWSASPAMAQTTFEGLGYLPGGAFSAPTGLSSDGLVVVGGGDTGGDFEAFRWTAGGGMVGLGDLAGGVNFSQAYSANADGSVVVGQSNATLGDEAFRWTQGGGMVGLGFLAGGITSTAYGVSGDGSVVVGVSGSTLGNQAFSWTSGGGMVGLGFLSGGSFSNANAISADASTIVGLSENASSQTEAFRWTQGGGMVGLGILSGYIYSSSTGANADGSVVIGFSAGAFGSSPQAFRWTQAGGMVGLGFLAGGSESQANGVSTDGSVVVGQSGSSSGNQAFRWTQADGMQSVQALLVTAGVNMTGWTLDSASGVSGDGRTIVGTGFDPSLNIQPWIAYFGPGGAGLTTAASQQKSLNDVSDARTGAMAQHHGFAAPLLGDDKPVEETSETGVYAAGGSASAGGWARYAFAGGITLHAGIGYAREDYDRAEIDNSVTGALALRYVAAPLSGGVAPFVEGGGWYAPNADLEFERTYANGAGTATGTGKTEGDLSYVFGRAGILVNLGKDQLAVSAELGRERLEADAYAERNGGNPFSATVAAGTDTMDLVKARLAYSFDITKRFDATVWLAGVYGFNRDSDVTADIQGIGLFKSTIDDNTSWAEFGGRVGYAVSEAVTLDVFANGVTGKADEIDTRVHGGLGARVKF